MDVADKNEIPRQLLGLPPPVAASDGGVAAILIARGLLRQWCSSDATLLTALRRRIARAIALTAALESGRYPTKRELEAWSFVDDSLQLAFPPLVAAGNGNCDVLLRSIREHETALRQLVSDLLGD